MPAADPARHVIAVRQLSKRYGGDSDAVLALRDIDFAVGDGEFMSVVALANPEAAVRVLYEVFPQTKPTGKDEATAIRDDVKVLEARAPKWTLEAGGVPKWGENSLTNYAAYLDFLVKCGVLKQNVDVNDVITNDLIDHINKFDPAEIAKQAKSYR